MERDLNTPAGSSIIGRAEVLPVTLSNGARAFYGGALSDDGRAKRRVLESKR